MGDAIQPRSPSTCQGLFSCRPTAFLVGLSPPLPSSVGFNSHLPCQGAKTTLNELAEVPHWLAGRPQSRRDSARGREGRLLTGPSELGGRLLGSWGRVPGSLTLSGTEGAARWGWEEGGHHPMGPPLLPAVPTEAPAGLRQSRVGAPGRGALRQDFPGCQEPPPGGGAQRDPVGRWWGGSGRRPARNRSPLPADRAPGTGPPVPASPRPCGLCVRRPPGGLLSARCCSSRCSR